MERQISLNHGVACLLWGAAFLLTLGGTISALLSDMTLALALVAHAVLSMGAAATLTVRNVVEKQNGLIRDAFQMGHETGRVAAINRIRN